MFADKVLIKVEGGRGGNGCVSFCRERFVPKGGPDGGDGGDGGNVILQGNLHEHSLAHLKYKSTYNAENGSSGAGKCRHGSTGKDLIISVPIGTIIRDLGQQRKVLGDINSEDCRIVIARGGKGGKGNSRYASSTNRAPRQWKPGLDGEEFHLELELKTIADVGLVGYPNVGKSTFLNVVSNAKPKIAAYPFTTLTPNIGTIEFDDFSRITIADIPGIVDGAHQNHGLGHDFLKHIERTKVLAYVLDMGSKEAKKPWEALHSLKKELERYQVDLPDRRSIILANKMDLATAEKNLAILKTKTSLKIFPISAARGEQVEKALEEFRCIMKS